MIETKAVVDHLNYFWPDRKKSLFTWERGPIKTVLPSFRICRVESRSLKQPWIYVTVGACNIPNDQNPAIEFVLAAPDDNARHIETLAMVAYYHATANRLNIGKIVDSGRPWLGSSACTHFLVSLPYPFGPDLEWCCTSKEHIRFLWLLPITAAEASYANEHGVESLEKRFDQCKIDAIDPSRKSVV